MYVYLFLQVVCGLWLWLGAVLLHWATAQGPTYRQLKDKLQGSGGFGRQEQGWWRINYLILFILRIATLIPISTYLCYVCLFKFVYSYYLCY